MGRIEQAIAAASTSEARFEFEQLVTEVHRCQCGGREDIDVAIRELLIRCGVPAAMLAEGSAEMGLVIQLARSLSVATLSFGMLKLANAKFARERPAACGERRAVAV